jgi:NADPH2:quinone reductase
MSSGRSKAAPERGAGRLNHRTLAGFCSAVQAIAMDRTGGPDVLKLHDLPVPEPQAGQVLVKLEASGINYIDVYFRTGTYPVAKLPYVPGAEGAGTVERCGPGVTAFSPGDRVASANMAGAYAAYAVVPAEKLVAVPDGVTLRQAAALMLQGMTAHYLCNSTFPLQPGQVAFVHAGAGGVGLLLTQLAKAKGATVITTISTPEKAELSRQAGADFTIDYTKNDFVAAAREFLGGRGIDVVYDSVGKTTWEQSLDLLRPRGYFVLYGGSSGPVPPFDIRILNTKGSLFATRPTLVNYIATPEELAWRSSELFAAVLDGTLSLRIEHTYPLADASRAHEELESRKTTGKLLLLP